jgi:hypothetical protein
MADNSVNQTMLDAFRQANGNTGGGTDLQTLVKSLLPSPGDGFSSALADASRQIDALRSANQTLAEVVQNNTQAVSQNSAAQSSGGKGATSTIGSVASTVFGSGLGIAPLVASIAHLITGSGPDAPPTLIPHTPPASLQLDFADTKQAYTGIGAFSQVTYGQNGLSKSAAAQAQPAAPQVSIQVNALDSRSFMDHSNEIALAVRQAMLNMHSLNDIVSDL